MNKKKIYIIFAIIFISTTLLLIINKNIIFPNYTNLKFKVYGMTCESCKIKITKELEKISGIKNINLSLQTKELHVDANLDQTSANEITKKLKDIGYNTNPKSRLKLESYNIEFR